MTDIPDGGTLADPEASPVVDPAAPTTPDPTAAPVAATTPPPGLTNGPDGGTLSPAETLPINAGTTIDPDQIQAQLRDLPVPQAVDQAVSLTKGDLKAALETFQGTSPDVAAKVQELAKTYGTDYQTVASNPKDFDTLNQATEIIKNLMATKPDGTPMYPNTMRWIKDPMNLAKAKDDSANLANLETAAALNRQPGEGFLMTGVRSIGSALLNGIGGLESLPAVAYDAAATVTNPYAEAVGGPAAAVSAPSWLQNLGGLVPLTKAAAIYNAPAKLAGKNIVSSVASGDYGDIPSELVDGSASIAMLAAAAYFTGPEGALATGAASAGGEQYQSDTDAGKSGTNASNDAILNGASNFLLQHYLGLVPAIKNAEETFATAPAKESIAQLIGRYAKLAGVSAARGAGAMGGTQAAADAANFATGDPEAFADEGKKVANALVLGAIGEGAAVTMSGAASAYTSLRNQARATDLYNKVGTVTDQSLLRTRDPEAFSDLLDQNLESGGAPQTIGVDADKVLTFYQGDRTKADRFGESLGLQPNEVSTTADQGGELQLPFAKYMGQYRGTDIEKALQQDVRLQIDDGTPISANEVEGQKQQVSEMTQAVRDQIASMASPDGLPVQLRGIRDQLMTPKEQGGAGYSASIADAHLSLLVAGVSNLAKQRGETTAQAFDRLNLSLKTGHEVVKTPDGTLAERNFGQTEKEVPGESIQARGAADFYTGKDARTVINLFKDADMSTFAHETGHIFLREMQNLIDEGRANDDTKYDHEVLKDFAGGELDSTPEGIQHQEKVTQAFEQYLREGKAPSVGLAGAFDRFRTWLSGLYRSLSSLGHPINDEVRGVFNRILASKQELEDAQEYYSNKQNILDLINGTDAKSVEANETKAKRVAELRAKRANVVASAADKEVSRRMKAWKKVIGGDAAIRELARENVDKLPVYQVIDDAEQTGGISLNSLEKYASPEDIAALNEKNPGLVKGRETTTLSETAKKYGVPLGKLLKELAEGPAGAEKTKTLQAKARAQAESKVTKEFAHRDPPATPELRALAVKGESGAIYKTLKAADDKDPLTRAVKDALNNGITLDSLTEEAGDKADAIFDRRKTLVRNPEVKSIDSYAADHNFDSPQDLLDSLLKAPSREDAINFAADNIRSGQEAEIRNDMANRGVNPADDSTHNDQSLAYLISEMKLMADQISKTRGQQLRGMREKTIKDAARDAIGAMKTADATRYSRFSMQEARLSREVLAAAKKGDMELAVQLRQQQIIQHALVTESIRARELRQDIEARYAPKKLEARLAKVENAYIDPIRQILSTYGLSDVAPKVKYDLSKIDGENGLDPTLAANLPDWLMTQEKSPQIPDSKGQVRAQYLDEPFQRFLQIDDAASSIEAAGSLEMKSIINGQAKAYSDYTADMLGFMGQLKSLKVPQSPTNAIEATKYYGVKAGNWLKDGLTMMNFLSKEMDNYRIERGKNIGPSESLFYGVVQSEIHQRKDLKKVLAKAQPHWDTLDAAIQRIEEVIGKKKFDIPGLPLGDANAPVDSLQHAIYRNGESRWTGDKLVAALLNMGNQGNREAMMKGYGFTEEQMAMIPKLFKPEELKAIQGIWDASDSLFPKMNETHFRMFNRHVEKVSGDPLSLIADDGTQVSLPGGYHPLVFDRSVTKLGGDVTEKELTKDFNVALFRPKDGFTNERVGGTMPPLLNTSVWSRHIEEVTRYSNYAAIIQDWNRITQRPEWRAGFEDKFGKSQYATLRAWLKDQARPQQNQSDGFQAGADKLADGLRQRAVASLIGGKFWTGILQRTSMFNATKEIGFNYMLRGIQSFGLKSANTSIFGRSNSEMYQKVLGLSEKYGYGVMSDRENNAVSRAVSGATKQLKPERGASFTIAGKKFTYQDVEDFAHVWINMNDRAVNGPVWIGAFLKHMETMADPLQDEEGQYGDAAKYADRVILQTQPSGLKAEQSEFQRNRTGWLRFFSTFMSWGIKFDNRLGFHAGAFRAGAITPAAYASHIAMEAFLEPTARYMLRAISGGALTSATLGFGGAAYNIVQNLVSGVPVVDSVPDAIQKKKSFLDAALDLPMFDLPNKIERLRHDTVNAFENKGDFGESLWDLARVTGAALNLPYLNVVEDIKRGYAGLTGNTELAKHFK